LLFQLYTNFVTAIEVGFVNTSGKSQQLAKSSQIDTLDPQLRDLDAAENRAKESTVDDQELPA
jgi:hypothetical protein